MRTLIFHCPRTGREIVSGIQLDDTSLHCVADLPVTLRCSCGDVHRMRVKDGCFGLEGTSASPPLTPELGDRLATLKLAPRAGREVHLGSAPMTAPIAFPAERVKARGNDNPR